MTSIGVLYYSHIATRLNPSRVDSDTPIGLHGDDWSSIRRPLGYASAAYVPRFIKVL